MYLTRDAILQRQDIPIEDVDVPEWGGTVRVRGMSGLERDQFEASLIPEEARATSRKRSRKGPQPQVRASMDNIRARICVWCMIDDNGNRVFKEADIPALGQLSAAPLDRVYDVASRLSGITDDDVEELAQEMVEHPFDETSTP